MKLAQLSISRMESGKTGAWYMEEQEFGKSHMSGMDQTITLGYHWGTGWRGWRRRGIWGSASVRGTKGMR